MGVAVGPGADLLVIAAEFVGGWFCAPEGFSFGFAGSGNGGEKRFTLEACSLRAC